MSKYERLDVREWKTLKKIFAVKNSAEDLNYYIDCIIWAARDRTPDQIDKLKKDGWIFEDAHDYPKSAIPTSKGGIDFDTNHTLMLKIEHDVKHALEYIRDGKLKDFKRQELSKSRAANIINIETKRLIWGSKDEYMVSVEREKITREAEKEKIAIEEKLEAAKRELYLKSYGVSDPNETFIYLGKTGIEEVTITTFDKMVSEGISREFVKKLIKNETNSNIHGVYCTVKYLMKSRPSDYEKIRPELQRKEEESLGKESYISSECSSKSISCKDKDKDTTSRKMRLRMSKEKKPIKVFSLEDEEKSHALYQAASSLDLAKKMIAAKVTGDLSEGAVEKRISNGLVFRFSAPILDLGDCGRYYVGYEGIPEDTEYTEDEYRKTLSIL